MASPGGTEVGRISIKVLPDTSDFKSTLKRELKEIEKQLRLEAQVTADTSELVREAKEARKRAEAALKDIKVRVDLDDQTSLKAGIRRIQQELKRLDETEISVGLNRDDLNAAVDLLDEQLQKVSHLDLKVDRSSMDSVRSALSQIESELAKMDEVEMKVKLDRDSLNAARADLTNLLQREIDMKVALDNADFAALRDRIKTQLGELKINPKLDEGAVKDAKRKIDDALMKIHDLTMTITPEMSARDKHEVEKQIDDLKDKVDKIKSEIQPEVNKGALLNAAAHLAIVSRDRVVNLVPKVSMSASAAALTALKALSGARVIGEMFEFLGNTLKNLDKNIPIIGTMATAVAGLSAWLLTAGSNMFALAQGLAQIGPAALALPGIFGGLAVGIGASIAAFKDFNKIFPQVKGALSEMQNGISSNFWAEAKAPFQDLIDNLLPKFSKNIQASSTLLGTFFGKFAGALNSKLGPILGDMFKDFNASIKIATGGTDEMANSIGVLGEVGAGYLPRLASWFVKLNEQFSNWLTKNQNNGNLTSWIDTGITRIKELGNVLKQAGGILAGLSRAADEAGGSSLKMLGDTLGRLHTAVDSEGFQKGLVDVLKAAHTAMNTIATVSGPAVESFFKSFGSLLTSVLPQVGTIIGTALQAVASALAQPAVSDGMKALFDGILVAVKALAPAMAPLGAAIGAILKLGGTMLAAFGPLIAAVLTPLAKAFTTLVPLIQPLVTLLSGALLNAVKQLTPIFMQLVPVVGTMLGAAFNMIKAALPGIAALFTAIVTAVVPLVTTLMSQLAPILPVIGQFLGAIATALAPIISLVMQIVAAVLTPLIQVLAPIVQALLPQLSAAFARLSEALQPVLQVLLVVVNVLMAVLAPAIGFIVGILGGALIGVINGVALVFEGLKEVFMGVLQYITGLIQVFVGIFTGDWDKVAQGLENVWNGIWSFLKGIWDVILGALEVWLNWGILGAAKKAITGLKGAFTAGWSAIKGAASAAWSGIKAAFSAFLSALRAAPSGALSAIRGLFSSCWSAITGAARTAWATIKSAFVTGVSGAVDVVKSLPGKAKGALAGIGSALINAGVELIKGFIKGIGSMIGSVKSKLKGLTDMIPDWKGPLPKDKVLLYGAGQAIIKGLIKGLESQFDNVKKVLGELTSDISKAKLSKSLTKKLQAEQKQLTSMLSAWDKVNTKLTDAKKKLADLKTAKADYAASVAQKIVDAANITNMEGGFTDIVASLKMQVEQAKHFADVLKKLKSLGLNQEMFDQLAQAGPQAGMAAAEALANAGKTGVDQVNELEKQLASAAQSVGKTASEVMFDNGIHMAEGLVKGLEKQANAIENQMLKIAKSMTDAIKKALGIHSPSRVMAALGAWVSKGLAKGVKSQAFSVLDQITKIANDVAGTEIEPPTVGQIKNAQSVSASVSSALGDNSGGGVTKVLNYYAAPGSSISAEEDLFAAANRARMVGW
ncbi:tape measure protein [Streptomyces phage Saftant]|uniref:Tape measure protein n=1 Tax=Streptomyces phage Saftant TaxID=2601693 RepID=A0A5J6D859_9CAUD|nr:tail length tape measure protein [Streptomyces phage Saftant]QEQ94050.1 tape measure protein [Streptomyces phage Saftant]